MFSLIENSVSIVNRQELVSKAAGRGPELRRAAGLIIKRGRGRRVSQGKIKGQSGPGW